MPGQDAASGLAPVVVVPPGVPRVEPRPATVPEPAPSRGPEPVLIERTAQAEAGAVPVVATPSSSAGFAARLNRWRGQARVLTIASARGANRLARELGSSTARAIAARRAKSAAAAKGSWWLGLRRWAAGGVFVLIVLGTAFGLVALALSQERPRWWSTVDINDPAVVEVAERFENALATIMSQARPAGEDGDESKAWTVRVNASDVNAWLNARLPAWMESREQDGGAEFKWPESVQELRVDFRDGLIHVGAKVSTRGKDGTTTKPGGNYFSAAVAPRFDADGSLWLPAERVALGRLTVPASWMLRRPDEMAKADRVPDELAQLPETREVLGAFAGRRAVMANPTIRLGDGRRVKLLAMTAQDGKLAITCRTLVREARRADAGE